MRKFLQFRGIHIKHLLVTAGLALVAGVVICHGIGGRQTSHAQTPSGGPATTLDPATAVDAEISRAEGLSKAFRSAAQKVLPAVVVIKAGVSAVCPHCGRTHETEEESGVPRADEAQLRALDVLGSGFLVTPDGLVLTNKHVVKASHRLVVQTADGKQYAAKQITTDPQQDVAALRVETKTDLPYVSLGDSDRAEIGDWVLTIGCPLELEQTVSAGIISAKNRSFCPQHPTRYLQTDAVINPGSSGGPLVALSGKVIGITTSIASEDGGYQGIGFAVPASLIKPFLTKVCEGKPSK